jgi:hypothetical protein
MENTCQNMQYKKKKTELYTVTLQAAINAIVKMKLITIYTSHQMKNRIVLLTNLLKDGKINNITLAQSKSGFLTCY